MYCNDIHNLLLILFQINLASVSESKCYQKPICEANLKLTKQYGQIGHVLGSLSSNILIKVLSGNDDKTFHKVQKAAHFGRLQNSCDIYSDSKCLSNNDKYSSSL